MLDTFDLLATFWSYLYLHVVRKHMSCLQNFKNFLRLETWKNGDKAYCFFVFYSPAVKNFPGSPVGILSWLNCTKKGSNKVSLIHFTRGVQLYEYGVLVSPLCLTRSISQRVQQEIFCSPLGILKIQKIYVPSVFKTPIPFSPFYPRWMTMDHWARRFLPDKFHCFFNEQKIWSLLLWAAWNSQIFSGDKDEMEILCSMPSLFSIAFLDVPIDIFWRFCQT